MTPLNSSRVVRTLCVLLLTLIAVSPHATAEGNDCARVEDIGLGWTRVELPAFEPRLPIGGAGQNRPTPTAWAVDRYQPERMFITNGWEVLRSGDGGCSWESALVLPDAPMPDLPYARDTHQIVEIVIPDHPQAHNRIYAVIAPITPGGQNAPPSLASRAGVVMSEDGGAIWNVGEGLVALGGRYPHLRVSASDPDRVYFAYIEFPMGDAPSYFYSTDAGRTWAATTELATNQTETALYTIGGFGFNVDPLDPDALWDWNSDRVRLSIDGGATWEWIRIAGTEPANDGARSLDLFPQPGGGTRALISHTSSCNSGASTYLQSDDRGRTFTKLHAPGCPPNVERVGRGNKYIISTRILFGDSAPARVFVHYPKRLYPWVDISHPSFDNLNSSAIRELTMSRTREPALYGWTQDSISEGVGPVILIYRGNKI